MKQLPSVSEGTEGTCAAVYVLKVIRGHGSVSVCHGKRTVPHDALKGEYVASVPEIVHGKATAEAVWPVPLHFCTAAQAFKPLPEHLPQQNQFYP